MKCFGATPTFAGAIESVQRTWQRSGKLKNEKPKVPLTKLLAELHTIVQEPHEHVLINPAERERARARFEAWQSTQPGFHPRPVEEEKLFDVDRLVALVEAKCPAARELEAQLHQYYDNSMLINLGFELGILEPENVRAKTRSSLCREIARHLSTQFPRYQSRLARLAADTYEGPEETEEPEPEGKEEIRGLET